MATSRQLETDASVTWPVALAIAESLSQSKAAQQEGAPDSVNLAEMITGVGEALTMQGAPQLEITLEDPELDLLESGFWNGDVDKGRLAEVKLNYPAGSKYWWRLRQVSANADFTVVTYWIPKQVRELMDHHGPLRISRGKRTRAEAIQQLCSKVASINFHSKQLDKRQPIAQPKIGSGSSNAKALGISAKATKGLTVKGQPVTAKQRDTLATLLQVADRASAGQTATVALIYAATWESNLGEDLTSNGTYGGVLGGHMSIFREDDIVGMAERFLHGGEGFQHGGAIAYAKTHNSPAVVASKVEGATPFSPYGVATQYQSEAGYPGDVAAVQEAEALLKAGGGATGGEGLEPGMERAKEYFFEVGTSNEPNENYWTAMNRWAQEVNWELVVDGPDFYFDSDITLARGAITDVVERSDENVVDWTYDWDDNHIATNLQLVVVCDEFEYHPPAVLQLNGFGTASKASTIGLHGRWLVGEAQRNAGDITATLTLIQPTKPLKEPAHEVENTAAGSNLSGPQQQGTVRAAVQAAQQLGQSGIPYLWAGGHKSGEEVKGAPPPAGLDCSGSVSWVLAHAGFPPPPGGNWGGGAANSTAFEQWGEAGQGKEMTVWCNADHVFIEFNVPGIGHYQLNTSPGPGPRWTKWGANGEADAKTGAFVARHWQGT